MRDTQRFPVVVFPRRDLLVSQLVRHNEPFELWWFETTRYPDIDAIRRVFRAFMETDLARTLAKNQGKDHLPVTTILEHLTSEDWRREDLDLLGREQVTLSYLLDSIYWLPEFSYVLESVDWLPEEDDANGDQHST